MDPTREELAELVGRLASARATIERLQRELAAVTAEQAAIGQRLGTLGFDDDGKTRVDPIEIEDEEPTSGAGVVPKPKDHSALKAGAVGAGLTIGLVIIVLLAMNLTASRQEVTATPATNAGPSASPAAIVAPHDAIPPPPAVTAPAAEAQIPPVVVVGAPTTGQAASAAAPAVSPVAPAAPAPAAIKATAARDYGF